MSKADQGVPFADPAVQTLLHEGKLDARWVSAFFMLPDADRTDERGWAPEFFRLRHFVSMYLPLRYTAWMRSSGKRNQETEAILATLIVTVAETLWRGLVVAARFGVPSEAAELVRLVFGADNPLRLSADGRGNWEQRYKAALRDLSFRWHAHEVWPRWEAMALHFASFYLPLGLPPNFAKMSESVPMRPLLNALAPHVHADVVQLVGFWLDAASAPRDDAGVPIVGWIPKGGRRITGRTETEILLLR